MVPHLITLAKDEHVSEFNFDLILPAISALVCYFSFPNNSVYFPSETYHAIAINCLLLQRS